MNLEQTIAKTESVVCTACEKVEKKTALSQPMSVTVTSKQVNGTRVYSVKFFHTECLKTVKVALKNCGVEFVHEKEWK